MDYSSIRIGHGYDVHRLVDNRALIIGGVNIPYEKGLLGHSDADVLFHAILDAILGALGEGDIGRHFPDHDDRFSGASGKTLALLVKQIMDRHDVIIGNIDSTIIAEHPKMMPYIQAMRENIADALSCPVDAVNVKATTEEKLGFTGSGEGIAAHAVCVLIQAASHSFQ